MISATILVFFFMLGASLLGFSIAWVMSHPKLKELKNSLEINQKKLLHLETEHKSILTYANQLHQEKEKLIYANEKLTDRLRSMSGTATRLEIQKKEASEDYQNGVIDTASFDQKINDLNAEIGKLNEEMEIVKSETLQWKVRYDEVLKEKEALEKKLKSLEQGS